MQTLVGKNQGQKPATAFVAMALAASVGVLLWAQWPLFGQGTLDQRDAVVVPSLLAGGLSATLGAIPNFLARPTPWLVLLVTGVWVASVLGYGGIAARWLLSEVSPLERFTYRFALGVLWLGLATALCGVVGAFRPLPLLLLLGIGVLLLASELPAFTRAVRSRTLKPRLSWPVLVITLLSLLYFGVCVLYAMTPPTQSDGMRYHLAAIQEYLRVGRLHYIPFNAFSNFPFLAEMHFAFSVAVGLPEVAQLVHFSFFVLAGLQLTALTRTLLVLLGKSPDESPLQGWLPAFLYWTLPANAIVASWPFIDQATNAFWFAAVGAWLLAQRSSDRCHYVLLGLLVGAAIGTKYTSLALAFLLFGGSLASAFACGISSKHQKKGHWHGVALFLLAALLAGGFWYLKNLVLTGNPFYPLGATYFGGGEFTAENASFYSAKMAEKGVEKTFLHFLLSPWYATLHWTQFEHHFLGSHALVVFALAAGALLTWRIPWPVLQVFMLGGVLHAVWFFSYQSNRMIAPALGLLASACVAVLWSASFSHFMKRALQLAVAVAAAHGAAYTMQYETAIHRPPLPAYLSGALSRDEYLTEALNYYKAFQQLGQRVKPGEKVLLVGEHRIFYAPFEAVWSDWFDTPAILALLRTEQPQSLVDFVKSLRRHGIGWVLVNEVELSPQVDRYWKPRFRPEEWTMIQLFINAYRPRGTLIRPGVLVFSLTEKGQQQ